MKFFSMLGLSSKTPLIETFGSLVGESTEIHGRMVLKESIRIDGKVFGNIEASSGLNVAVTVGPNGEVHGDISAYKIEIAGKVDGNVNATGTADLRATSEVIGDISYGFISVHPGANLKGIVIQKPNTLSGDKKESSIVRIGIEKR
jgi:cytoskeletal protein CcmA (bactofilin family)